MPDNEEFLTLENIEEQYAPISRASLYRAINEGNLTATKIGKQYLIRRRWLQVYLDRNTINPEASAGGTH